MSRLPRNLTYTPCKPFILGSMAYRQGQRTSFSIPPYHGTYNGQLYQHGAFGFAAISRHLRGPGGYFHYLMRTISEQYSILRYYAAQPRRMHGGLYGHRAALTYRLPESNFGPAHFHLPSHDGASFF